jgi:ubiquinone/menaquinone biosynthesis methyltransferase
MPRRLEKRRTDVPDAFNQVAGRYDLLTALNPGYRKHLRWSARRLGLDPGSRVLDLCCGTGLSTEALAAEVPNADIVGLDASAGMLAIARKKEFAAEVQFVLGDAMEPEVTGIRGPFDGILMAYGIRNVEDPDVCLARLYRLLRPGGTICFHEYSVADSTWSRAVWNAVTLGVVIPSGRILSGSARIYRYLRRSVNEFDGVGAFERRLGRAGYVGIRTERMDGWQRGIVHSFLARRPE